MGIQKITCIECTCEKCGHKWKPKDDSITPKICPECKSAGWNEK